MTPNTPIAAIKIAFETLGEVYREDPAQAERCVRIIDGPFADFIGVVDDILQDKGKVRVMVSFFGRETPIELDFLQVEKL